MEIDCHETMVAAYSSSRTLELATRVCFLPENWILPSFTFPSGRTAARKCRFLQFASAGNIILTRLLYARGAIIIAVTPGGSPPEI